MLPARHRGLAALPRTQPLPRRADGSGDRPGRHRRADGQRALRDVLRRGARRGPRRRGGLRGRGETPRPLTGLPVAVKDELPVAGQPCSGGSLLYAGEIADHSAVVAERILAAGGIVHARTTTPEFSCAG
ncbi:MAG: hypothetical protein EHM52_05315, partial [Actinomycetota bacterium]